jgi:hypothetical protein
LHRERTDMHGISGPTAALGVDGALQSLVGRVSANRRAQDSTTYLDGVRDTIAAAVELLTELEHRVPVTTAEDVLPDQEPLPLDRATQRVAADLRLTAATLSRLARREGQDASGTVPLSQLPLISDAVGLLLVAAHSLERVTASETWHIGPELVQSAMEQTVDAPNAAANWLAAFVVGVAVNREPTERDVEELLRLSDNDMAALEAAHHRVTEIDDLAEQTRSRALSLLEAVGDESA